MTRSSARSSWPAWAACWSRQNAISSWRSRRSTRPQATALLRSLRGAAVFDGLRGSAPADLGAVAAVIARVAHLITDIPEIRELDLNPVLASANGCVAVDWRILTG